MVPNLSGKRRTAAEIMKVGMSRVRIDPESLDRMEDAITRESLRALIKEGVIYAIPKKGISRGRLRLRRRAGIRQGRGSVKGAAGARTGKKTLWVNRVRAMRSRLRTLRERGDLTAENFRRLYSQVKGGQIRSLRHFREVVKEISRR